MSPAANPAKTGGELARKKTHAIHKRRFRRFKSPHTDPPLRKTPFQSRHFKISYRIHKFFKRTGPNRQKLEHGLLQRTQQEHAKGRTEESDRKRSVAKNSPINCCACQKWKHKCVIKHEWVCYRCTVTLRNSRLD
jgi:hypothetical protein